MPGWSGWSSWTSCSVTCGYGAVFREAYWVEKDGRRSNKTTQDNMGCYIPKSCPGKTSKPLFVFQTCPGRGWSVSTNFVHFSEW